MNIKKISRPFFWLLLLSTHFILTIGFAQQDGRHGAAVSGLYYYFGNQKILLAKSNRHIYVETNTLEATQSLSLRMQSETLFSGGSLRPLAVSTRELITLSDTASSGAMLKWLLQQPEVKIARAAVYQPGMENDQLFEELFYVKLKSSTSIAMLQNLVSESGCTLWKPYDYDKRIYLVRAGSSAGYDGLQMANQFYETGLFEYAEPDFRSLQLLHNTPPNDYLYPLQWGLKNTGIPDQFNGTQGADIGVEAAWQISRGNSTIRIAVIDEGVDRTHPDLINNIDPLGYGLHASVANTGNTLDVNRSHGTSCAGIIAAESNNSIGIAGVAPLCKIIPVNLTVNTDGDFGSNAQLAACIDWSWNQGGADVISNSWGGGSPSSLMHDAIKRATTLGRNGKGAIVLFSAGNNDAGVSSPAIFPETIAVGAMDMCYQRKSINTCDRENFWGSNYGSGLDVAAPGVKIATTKNGGFYEPAFNGTSAACPFASGVAALVLSIKPALTQAEVREILERSCRKVGNYTYSRVPGQPNGSWSPALGYGMINAHQALLLAQESRSVCKVNWTALNPTEACVGATVMFEITNYSLGDNYQLLRNGIFFRTNFDRFYPVSVSGSYQMVRTTSFGCRDTSEPIEVRIPQAAGALQARAGNDTVVCTTIPYVMGGSPSASGGSSFLNPMRGIGHLGSNNELLRFDPLYPSVNYKTIRSNFFTFGNGFFPGAATTPRGLYMISLNNQFVKVDTATGQTIVIGMAVPQSNSWNGMTYHPVSGKIYATTSNQLYEIEERTGRALFLGAIAGASGMALIWLAADTNGDLYTMRLASIGSAQIFKLNLNPLSITALPNGTGFQAGYAQDAAIDPITRRLLIFGSTRPLGSGRDFPGLGLWEASKTSGIATHIGSVAQPFNWMDALSFSGPEYKYSWSPATYLNNPKDANPVFSGAPPGLHTYTLTVTDLCGQTAQSTVNIRVKSLVAPNANGVLFVNAAATGNGTGSSWANAVTNLQTAIENSCHDVKQIWVAGGTYKPSTNNRDIAFVMRNQLAIYGGFAGNETSLAQRNLRLNPTILSGDIGVTGNRSDNSFNIISNINNGLDGSALLDGFIIRDGHANKNEYARSRGSGMYNFNSSPQVRNCIFTGNFSSIYGGAVFNQGATSTPTFINCVFSGNQALWGGGIYNESAQTRVVNSSFSANVVANTGGGVYSYGLPLATIRNSIIWGNTNGVNTAAIDNSTPIDVSFSIVQGGYTGTGNLDQNPLFLRQTPIGLGQFGDLRLLACSPGINAGSNAALPSGISQDLNGAVRIGFTTIDMGAYEQPSNMQPTDIYVDAAATGLRDGRSWANAHNSLQVALLDLNTCGAGINPTIHLAAGTYSFSAQELILLDKINARILGGYPAGGGTRNPAANPVIIRGEVRVIKNVLMDGVLIRRLP